jgi:hypothetical protein
METAGAHLRAAPVSKRYDGSAELLSQDEFFNRLDCER